MKKNKFILFISTIIVLIIWMTFHIYFMFTNKHPIWFTWMSFALSTAIISINGLYYFKNCYKEIFIWKKWGMFTLITLATSLSYLYSLYPLIQNTINASKNNHNMMLMDFFDVGAMIVTITKIGDYISDNLKIRINDDLVKITKLQKNDAFLYDLHSKKQKLVDINSLNIDDYVWIPSNSTIPIDGVVCEGESYLDESIISGEIKPIYKKINDLVIGGTKNISSPIIIKVTTKINDSFVNKMVENVKKISFKKQKHQKIIDRFSYFFTPFIILCSLLAFILQISIENINEIYVSFFKFLNIEPLNMDKWTRAFFYAIGTLSIACPCAIGIVSPLITMIGSVKSLKNGIMINTIDSYEKIKKINAIGFDKTGTLTEGKFSVVKIIGDINNLPIMYELEKKSIHPIAKSFVNFCIDEKMHLAKSKEKTIYKVEEIIGIGMIQITKDNTYEMVSLSFAKNNKYKFNDEIQASLDKEYEQNNILKSYICFVKNKTVETIVILEDKIKENAKKLIEQLKKNNIETFIISGDNNENTSYIANKLGIDHYFSDKNPSEKREIIKNIQKENKIVAYVGDGINDLEALKQSDLSIVVNKDNKFANAISDIVIINDEIMNVLKTFYLLKSTRKAILLNLFYSFAYNIITLPLSIIGIIPVFIGVFFMIFSNVGILINSFIFKNKKLKLNIL